MRNRRHVRNSCVFATAFSSDVIFTLWGVGSSLLRVGVEPPARRGRASRNVASYMAAADHLLIVLPLLLVFIVFVVLLVLLVLIVLIVAGVAGVAGVNCPIIDPSPLSLHVHCSRKLQKASN